MQKKPNHKVLIVMNRNYVKYFLKFFLYFLITDHHYNLFPRNFGELVRKYNVTEFHLSMTQGLWRYEKWGYPHFPAPPGAQLWVWFKPGTVR